jgi:hypothetical protein
MAKMRRRGARWSGRFKPLIPFSRDRVAGDGLFWLVRWHGGMTMERRRGLLALLLFLGLADYFLLGSINFLWVFSLPLSLLHPSLTWVVVVFFACHCATYTKTIVQRGEGFELPCKGLAPLLVETRDIFTQRFLVIYFAWWELNLLLQTSRRVEPRPVPPVPAEFLEVNDD